MPGTSGLEVTGAHAMQLNYVQCVLCHMHVSSLPFTCLLWVVAVPFDAFHNRRLLDLGLYSMTDFLAVCATAVITKFGHSIRSLKFAASTCWVAQS